MGSPVVQNLSKHSSTQVCHIRERSDVTFSRIKRKKMQCLMTYFSFLVLGHHSKQQSKNKVCVQTGLALDDPED